GRAGARLAEADLGGRARRTARRCRPPCRSRRAVSGVRIYPTRRDLFFGFAKMGLSGFGGVLAFARQIMVEERRWLDDREFAEMLALGQVLPGPNVVNLSMFVGA